MGKPRFPKATRLLITADAGGSNGYRVRAWKTELATPRRRDRARDHGLPLSAGHLEVEQDRAPHVQLHLDELARAPARVLPDHRRADRCHDHERRASASVPNGTTDYYETGVKVSDKELAALPLTRHDFHGDWNYTLTPRLLNQTCGEPLVTPTGKTFSIRIAITDAPFDVDLLSMTAEEPACTRAGEVPGSDNREVLPGRRTGDVAKVPTRWRSRTLRYETARYCGIPDVPPP